MHKPKSIRRTRSTKRSKKSSRRKSNKRSKCRSAKRSTKCARSAKRSTKGANRRRFGYSHDMGPRVYSAHMSDGMLLADNAFTDSNNPLVRAMGAA